MPEVCKLEGMSLRREQKQWGCVMGAVVKQAWGDWLSETWDWQWFVTLTFRDESVGRGRANSLWKRWVGAMEKAAQKAPGFVRVTEYQRYRGVPHYHALMLNVDGLRRLSWLDRWVELAGWARVLPYYPENGASYYISKYISKDIAEMSFSDNIQDFRKSAIRSCQPELFS